MKITTIIILCTFTYLLSGCTTLSTQEKQSVIVNNSTKTATLYPSDINLLPCDRKLTKIETGTFAEIVKNREIDYNKLIECSDKQKNLSDFINNLKMNDLK